MALVVAVDCMTAWFINGHGQAGGQEVRLIWDKGVTVMSLKSD